MLTTAFGKSTLSQKNVCKWYKLFTEGQEDVNDSPSWMPQQVNNQ
jgi:hypothetical protein